MKGNNKHGGNEFTRARRGFRAIFSRPRFHPRERFDLILARWRFATFEEYSRRSQ